MQAVALGFIVQHIEALLVWTMHAAVAWVFDAAPSVLPSASHATLSPEQFAKASTSSKHGLLLVASSCARH